MPDDLNTILGLNAAPSGAPTVAPSPASPPRLNASSSPPQYARAAMRRYEHGFHVALVIVRIGNIIRVAGVVSAIIFAIIGVALFGLISQAGVVVVYASVLAFVGAVMLLAIGYVFGTMVSAQGQILLANLDSAVHTSPFLTDDERAQVMHMP